LDTQNVKTLSAEQAKTAGIVTTIEEKLPTPTPLPQQPNP